MLLEATTSSIDSLQHFNGFLIVVFALTMLWVITAIFGRLFISLDAKAAAVAAGAAPATAAAVGGSVVSDAPTDEELVAVSACVAALMGQRSRVVSIRRGGDWSREGRREHFASKRLR
ncbi:MAG: OadG family transporter subunit [Puniceicoccaceae bacterium]